MRLINVDMTDSEICNKIQEISAHPDVFIAVRKVLASFPTIEAEPIRHGLWKKVSDKAPKYCCTECNHLYNNKKYKRCPSCGARMDGRRMRNDK